MSNNICAEMEFEKACLLNCLSKLSLLSIDTNIEIHSIMTDKCGKCLRLCKNARFANLQKCHIAALRQ